VNFRSQSDKEAVFNQSNHMIELPRHRRSRDASRECAVNDEIATITMEGFAVRIVKQDGKWKDDWDSSIN
jgi:hypothetical protein